MEEEPLQPPNTAVTVGWKNGKAVVTDGPYAEMKEELGGIQVLEARDLNHAIQLISQSPGVKLQCGTIEIRPAAEIIPATPARVAGKLSSIALSSPGRIVALPDK